MKQNNQQQAQSQDPTTLYNQVLAERLSKTIFDIDNEQRKYIAYIQSFKHCLSYNDLAGNEVGYKRLIELPSNGEINLLDSSFFLNGIDRLSPAIMGISIKEYETIIHKNAELAKLWNKAVIPIKTAVMREVQAKLQRNIIIPPSNKLHVNKN